MLRCVALDCQLNMRAEGTGGSTAPAVLGGNRVVQPRRLLRVRADGTGNPAVVPSKQPVLGTNWSRSGIHKSSGWAQWRRLLRGRSGGYPGATSVVLLTSSWVGPLVILMSLPCPLITVVCCCCNKHPGPTVSQALSPHLLVLPLHLRPTTSWSRPGA